MTRMWFPNPKESEMSTGIKPRPTTYKGVEMRSRLEAGFAMWLDQMRWDWAYEPECFAGETGQWLPDFRVEVPCVWHEIDGRVASTDVVYVEVKPATFTIEDRNALRPRMTALYASHPDAAAIIAQEETNPTIVLADNQRQLQDQPLDWTWTGLWPIDARRVEGPWPHEWWKGVDAA